MCFTDLYIVGAVASIYLIVWVAVRVSWWKRK